MDDEVERTRNYLARERKCYLPCACSHNPQPGDCQTTARRMAKIVPELRKYWSFSDGQQHTHTWHSREDFIFKVLPDLLTTLDR